MTSWALACDLRRTLSLRTVAESHCQDWHKTRNARSDGFQHGVLTGGSRKSSRLEKALPVGLEPTTRRLTVACSTN